MADYSLNSSTDSNPYVGLEFAPEILVICGSIAIFLTLVFIISYIPVLIIFITNKELNKHISYKIMTHLGLLDIIQLLGYMCMGIQMVLNSNFGLIPDKILGAFLYATWLGVIEMMLLLAVNRFIALTNVHISKKNSERLFIALFIAAYGLMLINLVILLLPEYGFLLNMTTYDLERLALETHLIDMQTNILFGILAISWALYLITIVHMIIKRNLTLYNNSQLVKDYEIRIFFQSLFICGYKSFVNGFTTYWIPPSVLAYYISFFVYLIESGYNPYMYFFTNRVLRRQILSYFKWNKQANITVVIPMTPLQHKSNEKNDSIKNMSLVVTKNNETISGP